MTLARCRFAAIAGLALLALSLPAGAQHEPFPQGKPILVDLERPLRYQNPIDALDLVRQSLSPSGTVGVVGKKIVVRDTLQVVVQLRSLLDDFDHPLASLRLVIQLVQAGEGGDPPGEASQALPEPTLSRLQKLLRFDGYRLLAKAGFEANEGTEVRGTVGQDYAIAFRLGTLQRGRRLRLTGLRLARTRTPDKNLLDSSLYLLVDQTLALGLTQDESSTSALMLLLTCTRAAPLP